MINISVNLSYTKVIYHQSICTMVNSKAELFLPYFTQYNTHTLIFTIIHLLDKKTGL